MIAKRLVEAVDTRLGLTDGRLTDQFGLTGVQAVYALGIALMLDEQRGLSTRIKQCGNRECQKFNCDFEPKGRPRRFCNANCKRASDNQDAVERVRRYRKKRKREG